MTIAENPKIGNEVKKSVFFTSEELDLLDIPESGTQNGQSGAKMSPSQLAVVVLMLTALASFALGMLAEHSIGSSSNGVVGQGGVEQGVGTPSFVPGAPATN